MQFGLEIMLQQTCVAQGTPYFLAFTTAFPLFLILPQRRRRSVKALARTWYYSRARNAKQLNMWLRN
jgi:A/G-specific adenine glycosylase